MAINLPDTSTEVVQRSKTDVQRELGGSNPFLANSWLGALVTSDANRIFDFYLQLNEAINLNFPDTTEGVFLERWATIFGVPRNPATQSSGNIVATGVSGSVIPASTGYQSSDGINYISTSLATITDQSISVSSIIRSGVLVTVTTAADHGLASDVPVTIAGATQTDYNGLQTINVTASNQFQYTITESPTSPATGTITASFTAASVTVDSVEFETEDLTVNQDLDAELTIGSPIAGVDDDASVDFGGLTGAVTQESDTELKERLLSRIQNPVAHFSISDIENQAKLISGVTRVFVEPVTPAVGQVTVYFMRDNDDDPIPDSGDVTTVKNKLIEILPANTDEDDLLVSGPTAIPTAFNFNALTPNTTTMQSAVSASLAQFFDEETEVGVDVDSDKYRSAIISTIDIETGEQVKTFTLTSPSGDITVASGKIATLGAIAYP